MSSIFSVFRNAPRCFEDYLAQKTKEGVSLENCIAETSEKITSASKSLLGLKNEAPEHLPIYEKRLDLLKLHQRIIRRDRDFQSVIIETFKIINKQIDQTRSEPTQLLCDTLHLLINNPFLKLQLASNEKDIPDINFDEVHAMFLSLKQFGIELPPSLLEYIQSSYNTMKNETVASIQSPYFDGFYGDIDPAEFLDRISETGEDEGRETPVVVETLSSPTSSNTLSAEASPVTPPDLQFASPQEELVAAIFHLFPLTVVGDASHYEFCDLSDIDLSPVMIQLYLTNPNALYLSRILVETLFPAIEKIETLASDEMGKKIKISFKDKSPKKTAEFDGSTASLCFYKSIEMRVSRNSIEFLNKGCWAEKKLLIGSLYTYVQRLDRTEHFNYVLKTGMEDLDVPIREIIDRHLQRK